MKIYVCVKHVPDSAAKITIAEKNKINESITFIMNPYDEHAVEEAGQLKAKVDDSEIIAVSLGKPGAIDTLQSALAMGTDRGILIKTNDHQDSILTAKALAAAITQDGSADIIFTGKESIDSEGFQTMYRLGAELNMPAASNVMAFALERRQVLVEYEMEAGARSVIRMPLPCIVGVGKGLNKPRYPTLPAIMKARKKEIKQLDMDSLNIIPPTSRMDIIELKPSVEHRQPIELKGKPQEVVDQVIRILQDEAKVI